MTPRKMNLGLKDLEMLATMHVNGPIRWKQHHIVRGLEALPVAW